MTASARGMEQFVRRMREHFHHQKKKALARSVLVDAEKERQGGIEGDWQQESPHKEERELIRHSSHLRFGVLSMRRIYCAGRSGDWESYLKEVRKDDKLSVWAIIKSEGMLQRGRIRRRRPFKPLRRTSCVKALIFSAESSRQMTEWDVSLCRTYALTVIASRLRTTFGVSPLGMAGSNVTGGVRRVAAGTIGGLRTGSVSYKTARGPREAKVFRADAASQRLCDNLIDSLRLSTNQQKDGDSPFGKFLQVCWRKVAAESWTKFIAVDNHEAVRCWRSAPRSKAQESGQAKVHVRNCYQGRCG